MRHRAKATHHNRTITVDFCDESTYFQVRSDGKAFVEFVLAFILALGFQLAHKTTCRGGGCLTRHSHYARVRLGGLPLWRIQCTTCKAVFTVLPHFVLRYRTMKPAVARDALIATHGGLSLEWCAVICHISPMALYRVICAFGQHHVVTVLTRCGLPLPIEFIPIKSWAARGSGAPGNCAGHSRVPSRDRGRPPSTAGSGLSQCDNASHCC